MKIVYALLALTLSSIAFAGPEDHYQNQSCYALEAAQLAKPTNQIPLEICLEEATLDLQHNKLYVSSYFQPELWKNISVYSLIPKNKDQYSFLAASRIYDNWDSSCGDGDTVEVMVSGLADLTGHIDPAALKVTVDHTVTNDTCHSQGLTTTYTYKLK